MCKIDILKTDNFTMKYAKMGSGTKTFVMIPGLSIKSVCDMANSISEAYKIFLNEYTIYCFDRIDNPKFGYSIYDMANDTLEAIKLLGLKDIYLFGASQGGMISALMVLKEETLFKKILVASTSFNLTNYTNIFDWIKDASIDKKEALYLDFSKLIYTDDVFEKYKDYLINESKNISENDINKFIIFASSLPNFSIIDNIKNIRIPFLMVNSSSDTLLTIKPLLEVKEKVNNKPNFSFYIYNDYGHALYDLAPDFKKIMLEFFNK